MPDEAPFSLAVNVRTLPKRGQNVRYEAPEDIAVEIARRYDLIEVKLFAAEAVLSPWKKDGIKVEGRVRAQLVQPCAISGDPIETTLDEPIEVIFVPENSRLSRPRTNDEGELILDPEGDDPPEIFSGDTIEMADVWLEFFALGMDPFARLENASFEETAKMSDVDTGNSPFAALASLKKH